MLITGSYILPLWPVSADKRLGPAPDITDCPPQPHPLINIGIKSNVALYFTELINEPFFNLEIPLYSSGGVHWKDYSEEPKCASNTNRHSFDALDMHTQQQLMHMVEQGPYQRIPSEYREVITLLYYKIYALFPY